MVTKQDLLVTRGEDRTREKEKGERPGSRMSAAKSPRADLSNPRIEDLKELAHWTAHHNFDTILQPTLQSLMACGYNAELDHKSEDLNSTNL